MHILIRVILTGVFFLLPVFPAYPAPLDKAEPIAQVYEIQGTAAVKKPDDGKSTAVRKGCLLGREDLLTLDKGASVGLYFKNGGRKEIQAQTDQAVYKVADLLPPIEAYEQTVPVFGATRQMAPPDGDSYPPEIPESGSPPGEFFYPQETVVLDSPPLIEFKILNGSREALALGGGTIEISENGVMVGSQKFESLEFASAYRYRCPKLKRGVAYTVEIRLDLKETLGNGMSISFPLSIVEAVGKSPLSTAQPFSDSLYRSFESSSVEYKGKKYMLRLIKQLDMRSSSPEPVIVIEFFIT